MPIGIGKSNAGLGGYVPQVNLTGIERIVKKRLFFSRRESALLMEKTVRGGFGNLDVGTVMATVADDDRLVPFAAITTNTHVSPIGKSFLVVDGVDTQATIVVSLSDSYRFAATDPVVVYNNDTAGEWLNTTVASIARGATTATITLGDALNSANFTVANETCIVHRTGADAANATSLDNSRFYILDQDIYTGEGPETIQPDGALTSVLVSNAIIYADVVENINAAVLTALNMQLDSATNGRHYVVR